MPFQARYHYSESVDSTNNEAIRRAKEGGRQGEVFIANQQTAGRGRLGRTWESPPSGNLYFSILLRPRLSPQRAVPITLVAAAALIDLFSPLVSEPVVAKWPNDIYVNHKKLAGILTEMESEAGLVRWVVCGIGLNLNAAPEDFSPEVRKIATSLKILSGKKWDRDHIASDFVAAFRKRYSEFLQDGPSKAIAVCDKNSYLKGRRIHSGFGDHTLRGLALGLDPQGFLLVQTDSGETVPVIAGDIVREDA